MDSCPPHGYSEPLAKRPQSPHASASRSFNDKPNNTGFSKIELGSITAAYRTLRPALGACYVIRGTPRTASSKIPV